MGGRLGWGDNDGDGSDGDGSDNDRLIAIYYISSARSRLILS